MKKFLSFISIQNQLMPFFLIDAHNQYKIDTIWEELFLEDFC